MTDREKLIELLDEVHHRPLGKEYRERLTTITDHLLASGVTFAKDTNVPTNPVIPGHDDQYNIAEMSYNNGYAKGCEDSKLKWIPVSERLPEEEKIYLCLVKSHVAPKGKFHRIFRFYKRFGFVTDGYRRDDVTHWMPLPEPPKENTVKP